MKMYFLVEAEVTETSEITADEIRTQLVDCAQPDEEVGFVQMRAWEIDAETFNRTTRE
jgi:hypothetical protein